MNFFHSFRQGIIARVGAFHVRNLTHTKRMIMRLHLTILAIIITCLQVTAGSVLAQQVSINAKGTPLKTVLQSVGKQTGYQLFYKNNSIKKGGNVTIKLKGVSLKQALEQILKDQPLDFEIVEKTIVITEKVQDKEPVNTVRQTTVKGKVTDITSQPIPGVSVKVKGTSHATITDKLGDYSISAGENEILMFSYLGYATKEQAVGAQTVINISLEQAVSQLNEIAVVSTGYQSIPKERATGSFVLIDSTLLNRGVTTNILERLDGVTSSVQFNKNSKGVGYNGSEFSIRGRSTINGDAEPLIVLDNFPFTGDISAINPNDIESITILKDAAAASIWGTKAGNGVAVITTKSGKYNQKTTISLNSNVTIGQKPQLYTRQQISNNDFIGIEQFLFDKGAYNADISSGYAPLSPAIEIMLAQRSGQINITRRDQMLDSLSQYDTRRELLDYYYRVPVNQQYSLNISGGSDVQKFFLSGGFDRNIMTDASTSFQRFSLNGQNTYKLWKGKAELISGLQFSNTTSKSGRGLPINYFRYPYMNFADENGNALASAADLRLSYIAAQQGKGLLDWYYRPLDELGDYNTQMLTSFRLTNNLTYTIFKPLKISLYHAYQRGITDVSAERDQDSYYTRNQVNRFTSVNQATGSITRPIAPGDITEISKGTFTGNLGRVQLMLDQSLGKSGILNGIAGIEVSDYNSNSSSSTLYGYNPEIGSNGNSNIDFTRDYPLYYGTGTSRIGTGLSNSGTVDRYVSYYTNLSYTYNSKYIISASVRKDESNIFGVKSNQKGVPLWSAGASWEISKENFYDFSALPYLRLRATYGYNGNVDKSTSAYLTATSSGLAPNRFGANWSQIINPPNPSLRWERVENINLALDFALKDQRVSGSIELYRKHGKDLIGTSPISPQTGITTFTGNSADLITKGIDLTLNTINTKGALSWNSTFLFNYVRDKVSRYFAQSVSNLAVAQGSYNTPLVGYPYDSTFGFRWAGLDNTGAPQAYLNNQVSKDYATISNSQDRSNLIFAGSGTPTFFGSLLNRFSWKNLELSFNIVYRAGYKLRRQSLANIYVGNYMIADYYKRWQKPGDELLTNVPAPLYPNNTSRELTYTYADILIYSADQVRLQDARLSLRLDQFFPKAPFRQLSAFVYGSNLEILWRANKHGIDPDSPTIKPVRNLSFGITAQF